MEVRELISQQSDLQPLVSDLGSQCRSLGDGGVDLVQSGMEARGTGAHRDGPSATASLEEPYELAGGRSLQVGVELLRPLGIDLAVCPGQAVRESASRRVFELNAHGDLTVRLLTGDD
ncbi:hypothetical protein [Streptomyces sp. NBC_01243]|uniref:hypothetical protein n=1 Tax=Streptomyces sp. NBC_01243 TaxID=2903796 RepID=UPI002E142A16|nr:hypothetical protein OG348_02315 [Streptomyces sp. NBC_01243]